MLALMEFPADFEFGPKMQACSGGERKFVWAWVIGGAATHTDAARMAGYVDNDNGSIRVTAHGLWHRKRVVDAIQEVGKQAYQLQLVPALHANLRLIENDKHPDHARTVRATLSSLGLGERTAVDLTLGGEISVNHTDAALADLKALLVLGVPEAKLVELFGFSGLSRYRKMLAEQERRGQPFDATPDGALKLVPGPVIEHEEKVDG